MDILALLKGMDFSTFAGGASTGSKEASKVQKVNGIDSGLAKGAYLASTQLRKKDYLGASESNAEKTADIALEVGGTQGLIGQAGTALGNAIAGSGESYNKVTAGNILSRTAQGASIGAKYGGGVGALVGLGAGLVYGTATSVGRKDKFNKERLKQRRAEFNQNMNSMYRKGGKVKAILPDSKIDNPTIKPGRLWKKEMEQGGNMPCGCNKKGDGIDTDIFKAMQPEHIKVIQIYIGSKPTGKYSAYDKHVMKAKAGIKKKRLVDYLSENGEIKEYIGLYTKK